jgi:hypothetical protein
MRIFEELNNEIEKQASLLCLKHDTIELSGGRINGYRVSPGVYASIYAFLLHQANLGRLEGDATHQEARGEFWFNFGGIALENASVKRFDVTRGADGKLNLNASLVTIANGLSPFEGNDLALHCCGNHCSNGCYNICPTYD